jgi:AcrR family transcriptional regulator
MKSAKIPWGSFYQYFNDKADMFGFVMENILVEIKEIEQKNMPDYSNCDALTQFANRLASTIELNRFKPEYVRIAMLQSQDDDPNVKKYFELQEEHRKAVIKLFEHDKQKGLIREDVDAAAVIDMVYLLSKETFFIMGTDGNAYKRRMETFLRIIRGGIRRS